MPKAAPATAAPARAKAPALPDEVSRGLDAAIAALETGTRTWSSSPCTRHTDDAESAGDSCAQRWTKLGSAATSA